MNTHQPLLSVIVPCYNAEKYINKCVSSIVGQTYLNLEILLINDGSTDETGIICDSWQIKDDRIRVIHKQNEGSSYARKTGVENITAEYVTFVDSDDWIDKDMYHNMMIALQFTNSDIVQCGICDVFEDGRIQHRLSEYKNGSYEIVDRIKGVLLILEDKEWKSYMWNKIFKKHLFDHVEFPKGRGLHEDLSIMHILFHHASQSVYLRDEYYYYLHRDGSITNPHLILKLKMKNVYDTCAAHYERYCFVEQHPEHQSFLIRSKNKAIKTGLVAYKRSIMYPQYFPIDYYNSLEKQLHTIEFTRKDLLKEVFNSFKITLEISVFKISPACYKILVKLYAKIIKMNVTTQVTKNIFDFFLILIHLRRERNDIPYCNRNTNK